MESGLYWKLVWSHSSEKLASSGRQVSKWAKPTWPTSTVCVEVGTVEVGASVHRAGVVDAFPTAELAAVELLSVWAKMEFVRSSTTMKNTIEDGSFDRVLKAVMMKIESRSRW